MKRRAIVAGGAGFIGSHVCERLLAAGYRVVCVDNFATGSVDSIAHLLDRQDFQLIRREVENLGEIPGAADAVLHLASPASPIDYLRMPVETLAAGSLGTWRLLDLAREKNARFLLASTSEVYGNPLVHPQSESYWGNVNPVGPRSVYNEAKRFAESLTTAFRSTYGLSTAIVRIFNTFGPRMRANDGRAIPTFIDQAINSRSLTVAGTGMQTRSFCYVSDMVEGMIRLLESDEAGPMNLGNPEETTVLEIAELVRHLCGSTSAIEYVPRPVDDPERRSPDSSLARRKLGWTPSTPVDEAIKNTISWFLEFGAMSRAGGMTTGRR